MKDKASLLDDSKWGNHFDFATLKLFARYMSNVSYPGGKKIREQGDLEPALFVICEGTVEVVKRVDDEKSETLIALRAGDTVGEMSLVDNRPSAAEIVATTPVKALCLDAKGLEQMAAEQPLAAYRFMRHVAGILSKRLRRMTGLFVEHEAPKAVNG